MTYITPTTGYVTLALFALVMAAVTYWQRRDELTTEGFLLARRNLTWITGGISIAASWIWAPALFVSTQYAYQHGLAGTFWFTLPNVAALAIFAALAPQIRERLPEGYTLPEYIKNRLQSETVHTLYLVPYFFYQLMAITVQVFAGGNLVSLLTEIPITIVMPVLALIGLAYTLISGFEASVTTDTLQMALLFGVGAVILPVTWNKAGGFSAVQAGFTGVNNVTSVFDPSVAFSLGVVTSISLISGSISDQQYWQRSFALKDGDVRKAFLFGACLFGLVPLALSTLGFLGANPNLGVSLTEGLDTSMIGVEAVADLAPSWVLILFVVMLLCGLTSTLDSGVTAMASLWVTDMHGRTDADPVRSARWVIVAAMTLGLVLALLIHFIPQLGLFHLWWIFNAVGATVVVPTVLSLYWSKLTAKGVKWGVTASFLTGLPLFIYANVIGSDVWIVASALYIVAVSGGLCYTFREK